MVTRIFVGRVQEKTTVDTLRKFFNGEAAKIDPNAFVSCFMEKFCVFSREVLEDLYCCSFSLCSTLCTLVDCGNFCFMLVFLKVTDVFIPRPFRSFAFVNFSSPAVAKELMRQVL